MRQTNLLRCSFLFLLTSFYLSISAQIQVGTGTNELQALPVEPYYGYSYSQVIYLASEINASGDITTLQWYFSGTSLSNSNDWTIYIGHTTKTSFASTTDWIPVASMTQVYSATFTDPGAPGWITFDITDWTYNGTDNIVVAVDENAASYNSSTDDFQCTSVTGNRGIYYRSDGTNPDPVSPPTANGTPAYIANIIFGGIAQACPNPSSQTESNLATTSVDLGWTENGSATTWNIEYGATGFTLGTGTQVTGVTSNPYTLSGLTANTTYDWYVQADCGGGSTSSWVGPSTFTTPCTTKIAPWSDSFETQTPNTNSTWVDCWTSSPAGTTSSFRWDVDGSGSTPSSGTGPDGGANSGSNYGYTESSSGTTGDFAELYSPNVDISGLASPALSFYYHMYGATMGTLHVDIYDGTWNNDEATIVGQQQTSGSDPWLQQIVDLSAYSGTIQVRFRGEKGTSYTSDMCIDDVSVDEAPSCINPSTQNESNISATSADLGWTENGSATTWNIEYGLTGFTQGTGTQVTGVTSNPYTLSGLTANTTYDWYVQADCGGGSTSSWIGPGTFTTLQTPAPVQSLPFSEDWESGAIGSAWNYDAGSVSTIEVNTASVHGGTYGLEQYGNSSTGYTTPTSLADAYTKALPGGANENWTSWNKFSVDLTSASNPWLSFWYAMGYQYNNNYNNFWVQVSTDGSAWTDLYGTQTNGAAIPYEKKDFDLSAYNGTGQLYIRFFHNGKYNTNYLWLDDISVQEVSCPDPSAQNESNIGATSADLGWTENGSATTWNIEYGATGFTQGTGTQITGVTSNPYTLSGLTASTTYDWYVQADCGGGSTSSWVGPSTFSTACASYTAPFSEDFENAGSIPLCWAQGASNAEDWKFSNTGSGNHLGNNGTMGGSTSSGGYFAWVDDSSPHSLGTTLESPFIDVSALTTPNLSFYLISNNEGNTNVDFSVDVWDGASWNTGFYTHSSNTANGEWELINVSLASLTITGDLQFRFIVDENNGTDFYDDVAIDDVSVDEAPTCPAPSAQTETNVTAVSADLGWTENGTATSWNIEWGLTGFTQGGGTMITGTASNPYSLTGLSPTTTYDWYVQADCGGEQSAWTGPHSFTTACGTYTPYYGQDFNTYLPECWIEANGAVDGTPVEGANAWAQDDYLNTVANGKSAKINLYSTAKDDWLISPTFDLSGGTYELNFNIGVCAWNTTNFSNMGSDDQVQLLASTDGGVTWTNLLTWTSANQPDNTGSNVTFSLSAYSGDTQFAFWASDGTTDDAEDYDFFVDEFLVRVPPSTAATWSGTTDNDWHTASNWTGGIPGSITDVTIPGGLTNYPTITQNAQCNNLTIESGPGGDGSLIGDNLLSVSGSIEVQRYVTGGVWHDLSASTQGQTVNNLYFGGTPDVWLRTYNEPTNTRTYITNLTDPLPPGAGFEIWVDAGNNVTVGFDGALQTTDVSLSTASTPALSYSGPEPLGYNLIGNPFTSPLDWDIGTWGLSDVGGSIWVWDPGSGSWKDRVGGAGSLTNGIIPMGQGFFIQATGASPTITIPVDARVHATQSYYKSVSGGENSDFQSVSLVVSTDQRSDELNIVFKQDATELFDIKHDARKMFSMISGAPAIYANQAGENLSTDGLPLLTQEPRTIEVHFIAGKDGNYHMKAFLNKFDKENVWLEDRISGEMTNLIEKPEFDFTSSIDDEKERFVLHFNPVITGIDEPDIDDLISIYSSNGQLYIRSSGNAVFENKEVRVYDMLGRQIIDTRVPASDLTSIKTSQFKGYAVVKVISESGIKINKVYIK